MEQQGSKTSKEDGAVTECTSGTLSLAQQGIECLKVHFLEVENLPLILTPRMMRGFYDINKKTFFYCQSDQEYIFMRDQIRGISFLD